jgi:MFS family permease
VSISLACWSGFTALAGFAQNFTHLALARVGVGIGEAGGTPPSHSLISDLYPKEKRAGALAVFALGIPIGVTLAYFATAYGLSRFGWRATFIALGVPGVLLAIVVKLTIREPARGGADDDDASKSDDFIAMKAEKPESFFERVLFGATRILPKKSQAGAFNELAVLWRAAKHLLSIRSYRAIVIGLTAGSFASYATAAFIVSFFLRSHPDLSLGSLLVWLGVINGTAYVLGVLVGGNLVDRLAMKNKAAYGWVPVVALALNVPFFLGAMWVGNPWLSLLLWWPSHMLTGFYLGPCFALAQTLAPVSIRALSTAIFFFIINFIALGFGSTYVGIVSDIFANQFNLGSAMGLRIALSSVILAGVVSIGGFYYLTRVLPEDWAKATGERAS